MLPIEYILLGFYILAVFYFSIIPSTCVKLRARKRSTCVWISSSSSSSSYCIPRDRFPLSHVVFLFAYIIVTKIREIVFTKSRRVVRATHRESLISRVTIDVRPLPWKSVTLKKSVIICRFFHKVRFVFSSRQRWLYSLVNARIAALCRFCVFSLRVFQRHTKRQTHIHTHTHTRLAAVNRHHCTRKTV